MCLFKYICITAITLSFSLSLSPSLSLLSSSPSPSHLSNITSLNFSSSTQDPSLFNPERWEPGAPDEEKLKTMYFPFAVGVRSCVGQNLALIEMKLVLASIFRSFEFELQSVVTKDYCLTLKPSNANMKVYSVQ